MSDSGRGQTGVGSQRDPLLDAAPEAIIVIGGDDRIEMWNAAAATIFGFSAAEALGRELAGLIMPAALRHAHRHGLRRYLDTGESSILSRKMVFPALRADGSEVVVEVVVVRLEMSGQPRFAGFARPVEPAAVGETNSRLAQRMAFLAGAGLVLDESLVDYQETLRRLADLTVPALADLTVIDLVDRDRSIRTAVAAAAEPGIADALEAMRAAHPIDRSGRHPVAAVLRTGRAVLLPAMNLEFLARIAQGEEHLALMRRLHYRSAIVVPLIARQHVIGTLSLLRMEGTSPYDNDDLVLAEDLARRAAMAVDNARLFESTRQLAWTLQRSLLPHVLPAIPGVSIGARYLVALEGQEVGGDFYDAFAIDDDRWGIAIGDVCGKGAEAAALTALARYTIRALASGQAGPAEVLRRLGDAVLRESGSGARLLTALFAVLTVSEGAVRLRLAAAGHPRPLILRAGGEVEPVPAAGPLIGLRLAGARPEVTVELEPDDTVVLYTDGLTDARAPGRILTELDLARTLAGARGLPPERIALLMEESATAGERPRDDIAILVIGRSAAGAETVHPTAPAEVVTART